MSTRAIKITSTPQDLFEGLSGKSCQVQPMQTFSGLCYVERADDLSKEGTASLEAFHRATLSSGQVRTFEKTSETMHLWVWLSSEQSYACAVTGKDAPASG